jgi:signal transduction histidine kinase
VLGQRALPDEARAEVAQRIAATAADLGGAVRGIVWSLRPGSLFTDELGRWIGERARDLLGGVELVVSVSELRVAMDLDVLRAVQLIAREALHNAARHASARRVTLVFGPEGDRWVLRVQDDGVGIGEGQAARADGGNGLVGIRRRAGAIGAGVEIDGLVGTRVELRFLPRRRRWG